MSEIKVSCEVPVCDTPAKTNIRVHHDPEGPVYIQIEVGQETRRVPAADLIRAIQNCTNTRRKNENSMRNH